MGTDPITDQLSDSQPVTGADSAAGVPSDNTTLSEVLVRYERWRQADARLVVGLTDGLNRLFSTDLAPARLLRGIGLGALGTLAPLRHLAMRRGMGLAGDLPKLARGEAL